MGEVEKTEQERREVDNDDVERDFVNEKSSLNSSTPSNEIK
jgi:hypothetical protein